MTGAGVDAARASSGNEGPVGAFVDALWGMTADELDAVAARIVADAMPLARRVWQLVDDGIRHHGADEGQDDDEAQDEGQARLYVTRDECVQREVLEPLGEYAAEHDVEGIAAAVVEYVGTGTSLRFRTAVEGADFWEVVQRHSLP